MTRAPGRPTGWLTLTLCVAVVQAALGCGSSGGNAHSGTQTQGSGGAAAATGGSSATVDGVTFPPDNEGHGGYRISQISSLIAASMTTNKPNIILLMIGTKSNWKTTLLNQSDKQHPTDAGYVIMGDTWYPAIKPFLH